MAESWPRPDTFEPDALHQERARPPSLCLDTVRRRRAHVPRLHFAYMQAKTFARHFLQNLDVSLPPGYTPDWQMWPIRNRRMGCGSA